jgi:hypothetical protein
LTFYYPVPTDSIPPLQRRRIRPPNAAPPGEWTNRTGAGGRVAGQQMPPQAVGSRLTTRPKLFNLPTALNPLSVRLRENNFREGRNKYSLNQPGCSP